MVVYTKKLNLSYNLLYPLLGFKKNPIHGIKPIDVYLYWQSYSIEDFHIITKFDIVNNECEKEILENKYLISCFENNIYVFDLTDFSKDVICFINGNYSDISEKSKQIIFKYHNIIDDKKPRENRPVYQILRPEVFYKTISDELEVSIENLPKELYKRFEKEDEELLEPAL